MQKLLVVTFTSAYVASVLPAKAPTCAKLIIKPYDELASSKLQVLFAKAQNMATCERTGQNNGIRSKRYTAETTNFNFTHQQRPITFNDKVGNPPENTIRVGLRVCKANILIRKGPRDQHKYHCVCSSHKVKQLAMKEAETCSVREVNVTA